MRFNKLCRQIRAELIEVAVAEKKQHNIQARAGLLYVKKIIDFALRKPECKQRQLDP